MLENYIKFVYYKCNYNKLGENKAFIYSNMYSNIYILGCVYKEQKKIINNCPESLKGNISIPEYFKKITKEGF